MKKNYAIATIFVVAILLFTNTDFYKRHVLQLPEEVVTTEEVVVPQEEVKDATQTIPAIEKAPDSLLQEIPIDSVPLSDTLEQKVKEVREPKIYTIQTELLEIKISDKGAAIKSVTLRNYKDDFGKPLKLFDNEKINNISLSNFFKDTVFYSIDADSFIVVDASPKVLRFEYADTGLTLVKEYTIEPNSHKIRVDLGIQSTRPFSDLSLKWNSPIVLNDFEDRDFASFVSYINNSFEEIKNESKDTLTFSGTNYFWTGMRSKYFFGGYVFPSKGDAYSGKISTDFRVDRDNKKFIGGYSIGFEFPSDIQTKNISYNLFFAPIDRHILSEYGYSLIEIARYGFHLLAPISNFILLATSFMNGIIGNWGVTIVVFSVLLKLLLYPLNKKTIVSSRKMQELQPVVKDLQQKHKSNPQLMQMEMMKLYKKHKVNPLAGCLPMLLQMPIFFALYSVFRGAIEFRHAPFVFWIQDLSQPEVIAQFDLGFFTLNLGVLVIISSLAMFFQMKMTITDPRQKFMPPFMSIFLFFIFSSMSAGLNLYWATFNVMQVLQQVLIDKKTKKAKND